MRLCPGPEQDSEWQFTPIDSQEFFDRKIPIENITKKKNVLRLQSKFLKKIFSVEIPTEI